MTMVGRKPRSYRRRVDQSAWVAIERDFALQPCTVVDLSDEGARLNVERPDQLPQHFRLTFSRATRNGRRCEVSWKHGRSVGVRFVA